MRKILLAGDIMLDNYIFGTVSRISPEAPVPVLLEWKERQRYVPGGAANVAANLRAAGADVVLFSVVGQDAAGGQLVALLKDSGVDTGLVAVDRNRPTTTKLRYIGQNNQQVLRVDAEEMSPVDREIIDESLKRLEETITDYGLIVLSDYGKGLLSAEICQCLIRLGSENKIPVLVDVKGNDPTKYRGATILKPNRGELSQLTGLPVETMELVEKAAHELCRICGCRFVLTTLGADGMLLCRNAGEVRHISTSVKEVYDVTGAGDTALSYLAVSLANGDPVEKAVETANLAAGVQVSKVGTSIVYPEEVERARYRGGLPLLEKQLNFYRSDGLAGLEECRQKGKKIVFTNGCFDILHAGHVRYLNEARKLGDCLMVGVNSDASVRRLKGEHRPVNNVSDRMMLLAGLSCVDFVAAFEEDTPLDLIHAVRPDVLVKGGDYDIADIVGADFVASYGGTATTVPYIEGKSTTGIIERMRQGE